MITLLLPSHTTGHAGPHPAVQKVEVSAYFAQVVHAFRDSRKRNLTLLDEIGEAGLDRLPKDPPPGFEELMKTFGHTFLLITLDTMGHYGEIADARRVAGRKPLM